MSHEHLKKTLLAAALIAIGSAVALPVATQAAGTADKSVSATTANPASEHPGKAMGAETATGKSTISAAERKFIESAARGDIAQVELGKLAAQKGTSNEVKQFGQRMVDDHSKAEGSVKQLATEKSVTLPTRMDASSQREYDRLEKLSGTGFDREYMRTMVSDHEKDIKAFRREERTANDADVKTFAKNTLPTLEEHLKLAKSDQTMVKSERRTATKSQARG